MPFSCPDPRRLARFAALVAAVVAASAADAGSSTLDVRLGDEIEQVVAAGDVHTFRLDVVAGTTFRVRARTHDESGGVTLTLRAPDGSVVESRTGADVRISAVAAASGVHRAEVTVGTGSEEVDVHFEGETPSTGGGGGTTGAGTVHLDVPRGAVVRIEARRVSGAPPEITGVRDGSGREIPVRVERAERRRVRLQAVPASAPGGLDVDVRGRDGADGTYEVRFRILDEDDAGPSSGEHERESRRLVLALAAGADPAQVAAALGYELKQVGDGFIVVETESEGTEYEDAAGADDLLADVISAEPDLYVNVPEMKRPQGTQSQHVILGSDLGRTAVPDQPAMDQIRAAAALRVATGAGVKVAVLDSGADLAHEMLAGHLLPGFDFVDGDADPSEETNGLDDDLDGEVDEGFGHGTFVAGLVLAVAPNAEVMPVRVLDTDARGTVSSIAAGVEWAVRNGADVINLSLGMDTRSGVLADAINYAIASGVVVVAATGNGSQPAAVSFPASMPGVVAVTATDPATQGPADFANGGPAATVAAPGASVVGPYPGGRYGTWSGTSFSSALASGGAALVVQARPALVPAQVSARFRATARPAPAGLSRTQRRRLGGGRLDLGRLVR
jgi:hypothetical protein